mmetsp:Transcript_3005/g.7441  ORF Transcript_3005/g.7441 Transcript_3005/m.7441 type:complete len:198 (-) Transcript_3005:358-951(-)|eukprot:CAMPEP_0202868108 /NCGR_PEP_ID=MMETSP1391-20130828/10215_1 /ASSEMBLY_ACC=CAM_ASM_000867 /TAXON_ID=1034604 /ORGANISM="Chlamydomonas leiostraca, Strain SAG 11-49" /LENGTH=197 /DNA_ID=CAMNT_0049548225 /DNA_START=98 /DNA_END=691 /DNA_ORIENTATION=+
MAELTLKICVVGPCKTGKTLLCRALAEQTILQGEYHPTAAIRIQEFSRALGVDRTKVQLWDCSGSMQYQPYWSVLAKELDGIVMVIDPQHPEQEKELETFYMNFAQPNSLTIKQCLVLAIQVVKEGSYGLVGWNGLQGKLSKLNQAYISLNPASPQGGLQDAYGALDKLLAGCLQHKKDTMERQVMDEEQAQEGDAA